MKKPYLKISRLAEDQDLNQGALAALIGVSSNTMTARLKGTQPWRSDEIVIICRALHIPQEKNRGVFLPGNRKGGKDRMKIKSRVWYWLAAASGAVSLLYGMGIEGGAQLSSSISDSQFVTALCLVLAAVAFLRLGFAAQDREQNARRYGRVDRTHARTEEPDYRQNRRGA